MHRRGHTVWVCVGLGLAAFYVAWASYRVHIDDSDLIDFHRTGLHWWQTGEFTQGEGVRHYLPAFVILVAPLVAWPLKLVAPLWTVLNIALLLVTVRECGRVLARSDRDPLPFSVRRVWPIVLVLPYLHSTLGLGQVNLPVLCLGVLAFSRCWESRRDMTAGALIALAGVIKIYPLLLVLFWLARGRWRAFASAAIAFVLLTGGLSAAGFGWEGSKAAHRLWLAEVRGRKYQTPEELAGGDRLGHLLFWQQRNQFHRHNNQSLAAVVRRLTTDPGSTGRKDRPVHLLRLTIGQSRGLYYLSAGAVLGFLLIATWARRKGATPAGDFRSYGAWLAGVVAFVPIYWTHYFVLLLPAMAVLSADVWRRRREKHRVGWSEVLFALWLLAIPLLGLTVLRLAGLHCWLALATMVWATWPLGTAGFDYRRDEVIRQEPEIPRLRDRRAAKECH
ncbi:MAG TPA: glycosyltransferase family 87 protein [Phycisphaerae bacterium]|nr:glycosyltransferase family 87 protein [Phycisphaerae bacterium]